MLLCIFIINVHWSEHLPRDYPGWETLVRQMLEFNQIGFHVPEENPHASFN